MSISQGLNGVKIAQLVSVPAAGFLSGMIACMSVAAIPAVAMASGDTASKQWKRLYDIGSTAMPPLVVGVAACFGYLASSTGSIPGLYPSLAIDPTRPRVLYIAAAAFLPSIVPFTVAFMKPTNDIIMNRAKTGSREVANDAQIASLLQTWSGLNLIRAILVGTGALLAGTATALTL